MSLVIKFAILTMSTAPTGSTTNAISDFQHLIIRPRVITWEVITHRPRKAATSITPLAVILWQDGVTTSFSQLGRKPSATRPAVTTATSDTDTTGFQCVTSLNITVLTSLRQAENVTYTHPSRSTAAHVNFLAVISNQEVVITPTTVRCHCFSSVTANAMKIRVQ